VKAGIDAGRATLWRDGVAYLGSRPTFAGATVLLEVHLFDFAGDLYGRHLRVALLEHLRPDQLFDGMASLRAQIAADAARARAVLASYAGPTPGAAPVLAPRRPLQAAPRSVYERALRPRSTTGG
jgi:riboflavin kinase/FMN adenylyltransferase